MNLTKNRFLNIIKTHITYIGIITALIGFTMRYSIPSLVPSSGFLDLDFFGAIFIEFGILLLIGNWLLDKYKEEVNETLLSQIIDEKIGLRGLPLLTELVNLVNPFSYNVGSYEAVGIIKKDKSCKGSRYSMVQTRKLTLYPQQDNVYYVFSAGSSAEDKKPKIVYVKLNSKELILSKEIEESTPNLPVSRGRKTHYKILVPLKEKQKYQIEIKIIYPNCMSDLSDGEEYDWHDYSFFALTEKVTIRHRYEFSDFDRYEFRARKYFMNLPDVIDIDCKSNNNSKEIIIESGNLKNGDSICLTYKKKKS